jgi:hypothetical protein
MPVQFWNNKVLFVDGKIAMHEDCCCETGGCDCPLCDPCPDPLTMTIAGIVDCAGDLEGEESSFNRTYSVPYVGEGTGWSYTTDEYADWCNWENGTGTYTADCGGYTTNIYANIYLYDLRGDTPPRIEVEAYLWLWAACQECLFPVYGKSIILEDEDDKTDCGSLGSIPFSFDGKNFFGGCPGETGCDVSGSTCTLSS